MRVLEDEQQLCPCYKEYQEFQKLVELKDSGLVVYCHRPRKEDIRQAEAAESAVNTSRHVFILCNKKDVKITSSELRSELEPKNISCPRCRKTFEQAQKLMQEVKSIDKKIVMGICDHCSKKVATTAKTIKKPFCACNEIVKKFISIKGEQKEDIKNHVKIWLSKLGYLLKDDTTLNKPKQVKTRAYSDLHINRGLNSTVSRHEPEVQQMFYSEKHKSEINLYTEKKEGHMKQAVAFFQSIEYVESTFAHIPNENDKINTMIPSTSLEDWDTTFVETCVKNLPKTSLKDHKQEEVFEDDPSIDAKEALKRRHDLSLRQMMRLEKDSEVPYSLLKRPDKYETPKIAPWAKKDPTSKYHVESEVDIKIPIVKHERGRRGTRDLDYVSNREVKFRSTRAAQDSYYEQWKADKYHHDKIKQGLYDSEESPKKVKKLEDRYITDEELKLQRSVDKISHKAKKSDQHVAKSKSWHKKALEPTESEEFVLKPQYSFFFPKVIEKEEKQVKLDESSSHLIKDVLDKIRLHAERDMKKREEERQEKPPAAVLLQEAKKDLKAKPVKDDKSTELLQKTKKYLKAKPEKPEKGNKTAELLQEAKKDLKAKPEKEDKTAELLQETKKDLKAKPEKEDRTAELLQETKKYLNVIPGKKDKTAELLQEAKKYLKAKLENEDKTTELLQKVKKDLKSKPEKEDKTAELKQIKKHFKGKSELNKKRDDEVRDKEEKNLKEKSTQKSKDDDLISKAMTDQKKIGGKLELIEKGSLVLKSGIEQKDKISVSEKPKKDFKAAKEREELSSKETKKKRDSSEEIEVSMSKIQKSINKAGKDLKSGIEQQKDKGVEKKQSTKTEKAELGEKLQRKQKEQEYKERLKQLEQLRQEKEALQKQAAKEREEISKDTKKKRDSSEDIKVSWSKIQKSINKGEKDSKSGIEQKDKGGKEQEIFMKKQEERKEKERKQKESKPSMQEDEFKKLQAERLKAKEIAFKKKTQLEHEAKVAKAQKETELKEKTVELKQGDIKVQSRFSEADLILRLVRIKQAAKLKPSLALVKEIDAKLIKEHKLFHHKIAERMLDCPLCLNSELELQVSSLDDKINLPKEIITDIIIGEKIFKIKRRLEKTKEPEVVPKLYRESCFVDSGLPPTGIVPQEVEPIQKKILSKKVAEEEILMEVCEEGHSAVLQIKRTAHHQQQSNMKTGILDTDDKNKFRNNWIPSRFKKTALLASSWSPEPTPESSGSSSVLWCGLEFA